MFLDDSPANVETARKLGMQGIAVRDQAQAEEELKRLLEEQTE